MSKVYEHHISELEYMQEQEEKMVLSMTESEYLSKEQREEDLMYSDLSLDDMASRQPFGGNTRKKTKEEMDELDKEHRAFVKRDAARREAKGCPILKGATLRERLISISKGGE